MNCKNKKFSAVRNFKIYFFILLSLSIYNCHFENASKFKGFISLPATGTVANSLSNPVPAPNPNPASDPVPNPTDTTEYALGGTITGLTGEGFVIMNDKDLLSISANLQSFQFSGKLKKGQTYLVEIKTFPSSPFQACTISNAVGVVQSMNITDIEINCSTGYQISGTVAGLTGTLVLQNNSGSDLSLSANGSFPPFSTPLANLASYSVTVKTHPSNQVCYIAQGIGIINSANVTNIDIQCTNGNVPPGPLVGGSIVKELIPQYGTDNPSGTNAFAGGIGVANTTDGIGTAARFNGPYQITTDGVYIYVADRDNNRIRRIRTLDGFVETFANDGNNNISTPTGITTDGVNVYIATQTKCQIVKIKISTGVVTVIGGGAAYSCAVFNLPLAITIDGVDLYVSSFSNNRVLKLNVNTLAVSTIVGNGTAGFADNANGTSATISGPRGIIKVGDSLFVSTGGHSIRKVDLTSGTYSVTTLAGSTVGINGITDGFGTAARFFSPFAISSDGTNLYVADSGNKIIRKIVISSGLVTTLTGCHSAPAGTTIGSGNPLLSCVGSARYREPSGLTSDGFYLYASDDLDHIIRRIE